MKFDIEAREELRQRYDVAVIQKKKSFMFRGTELVVGYAKYLLEFLDLELGEDNVSTNELPH